MITKISDMLQSGAVKKGVAKQSRIKSIAWHLRWLVRTRADISLRPSGYQVEANWIGKIIQEQIYMQIFLNWHLAAFLNGLLKL